MRVQIKHHGYLRGYGLHCGHGHIFADDGFGNLIPLTWNAMDFTDALGPALYFIDSADVFIPDMKWEWT